MTSLFDKLNLRPGERRLVVIAGSVVFVFLNLWLVFPHFGDLGRVRQQIKDTAGKLREYRAKIDEEPAFKRRMQQLAEQGAAVAEASRALELSREVTSQALVCGVQVKTYDTARGGSSSASTNAYFDEQTLGISTVSGEKELICFLYSLAERSSLIRVRSMNLKPEVSPTGRHRLQANITLVGSYQKKPATRPATYTATPPRTATPAPQPPPAAASPPRPAAPPASRTPAPPTPPPPGFRKIPMSPPPGPAPAPARAGPAAIPMRAPTPAQPAAPPTRPPSVPQRPLAPPAPGAK
ncbi:MAG: hypothetical protein JXQ71_04580 [Verrucomicrobia bacterium]|nr:hypothetical protein [Verrucomicrobiota bacterium]